MTGFGSASSVREGVLLHVEIRTVNNKFYKSNFRVPEILQGLETEIEQRIASYITRGSVTFTLKYSDTSENAAATINTDALKSYVAQLKSIGDDISIDAARLLSLPGVVIISPAILFSQSNRSRDMFSGKIAIESHPISEETYAPPLQ